MTPLDLPVWATLLLVVLASMRLWRLIALDELTQPTRDRLPIRAVDTIVCPWCSGWWVSLGVTASALAWHHQWWWQLPAVALSASLLAAYTLDRLESTGSP